MKCSNSSSRGHLNIFYDHHVLVFPCVIPHISYIVWNHIYIRLKGNAFCRDSISMKMLQCHVNHFQPFLNPIWWFGHNRQHCNAMSVDVTIAQCAHVLCEHIVSNLQCDVNFFYVSTTLCTLCTSNQPTANWIIMPIELRMNLISKNPISGNSKSACFHLIILCLKHQ